MRKIMILIALAVAVAGQAIPVSASDGSLPENDNIDYFEPDSDDHDSGATPDLLPEGENSVQDFPTPVPDIASESESIGEFGSDDNSVQDSFFDFIDNVGDSGFDFVSPSPFGEDTLSPSPSVSPLFPDPLPSVGVVDDSGDIFPYAIYNTYYGSIGTTYLEYMRGFLPKLGFREHYVASRTSQYDYIFAYGENLTFNGSTFSGSGITVVTWNTYNTGTYSSGVQSSFSLNPGSYLVYSDLSKVYPSLADSAGFTLRQILILLTAFILGLVIDHMYQVRKIRRVK